MGYSKEIVFDKTADETLDYMVEWKNWLGDDVITSDEWDSGGLTVVDTAGGGSSLRTIWLSGGTVDAVYRVVNTVNTANGRRAARSFYINIVLAR